MDLESPATHLRPSGRRQASCTCWWWWGSPWFVLPRAAGGPVWHAAGWGALFGVMAFGVYDLTNYATLNNWPLALTVVDMAWGAFVCASVASVMYVVGRG